MLAEEVVGGPVEVICHPTEMRPTGRVIAVKGRISRKIGYDGKFVTFERA